MIQLLNNPTLIPVVSAPPAKSLADILHKSGAFTYDKATDSLEALRDYLSGLSTGDLAAILAAINAAVPGPPTAKSLQDILHKDGGFTFDHTTDSLEAIRDYLVGTIYAYLSALAPPPLLTLQEYLSGSGNWTVPAGIYMCNVLLVAPGGGGGGCADGPTTFGGGGGGGEVVSIVNYKVVPGASIAYAVGAAAVGGPAGDWDGGDGGNTKLGDFIAYGGKKGGKGSAFTGGIGGQSGVTGGAVSAKGTSWGVLPISRLGGGGGSGGGNPSISPGACVAAAATLSAAPRGGAGGSSYGIGATSKDYSGNGVSAAANTGGGGGGAATDNGGDKAGGNGGSGYIRLSWRK